MTNLTAVPLYPRVPSRASVLALSTRGRRLTMYLEVVESILRTPDVE